MILHDQLGREIHLEKIPSRIISVVPSITELLFDLGLKEEVIGVTKFCIHPDEWFKSKQRVGGTKQLKIDLIKSLHPDLIIANKEENTQNDIDALSEFTTVYISDIKTMNDAYKMITDVGELVGKNSDAEKLTEEIKAQFQNLKTNNQKRLTKKALYFIWREPYMVAGGDTFISDMMLQAGFDNAAKHLSRYPQQTKEQLNELNSREFFLSSEPFPFKEKHITELTKDFPGVKITLVDGEMFSWYGSRMKLAPVYFQQLHL